MLMEWKKGLDKQKALDLVQQYKEALILRRRLVEILQARIEERRKISSSETLYDSPNWQYLQADRMGYERALRDIIQLILDKE